MLAWLCVLGAAVSGGAYVLSQFSGDALIPRALLFGGLMVTIYGLGVAHVNDVIDTTRLVEFTGGLLLIHGVGAAIGPTLAGAVMDDFGPGSLMLYFAVLLGGGSQVVLQMDPRGLSELDADPPKP